PRRLPSTTLFPYTTLFRSRKRQVQQKFPATTTVTRKTAPGRPSATPGPLAALPHRGQGAARLPLLLFLPQPGPQLILPPLLRAQPPPDRIVAPCAAPTRQDRLRLPLLPPAAAPRHPPSPLRAVEFVADPPLVERAPDAVEALTPLLGVICGHTPTLDSRTFPVQTCSVAVSPASADHAKFWLGVMRSSSGMPGGSVYCVGSESYSRVLPTGKPPTTMVGGSVAFVRRGRRARTPRHSSASPFPVRSRASLISAANCSARVSSRSSPSVYSWRTAASVRMRAPRSVAVHCG